MAFGGIVNQDVTITINGAGEPNDSPVITVEDPGDITGTAVDAAETSNPSASTEVLQQTGEIGFADVDLTDTPQATEATSTITALAQDGVSALALSTEQRDDIEAAFTILPGEDNANNGTVAWDYSIEESKIDFLGAGEVVTAAFTITVTDDEGATDTQDVTLTIEGSNDTPVISVEDPADVMGTINDAAETSNPSASAGLLQQTGQISFADVDLTDRPSSLGGDQFRHGPRTGRDYAAPSDIAAEEQHRSRLYNNQYRDQQRHGHLGLFHRGKPGRFSRRRRSGHRGVHDHGHR